MKDIDFIPDWYKSGRKKGCSYRRQYYIVGFFVASILLWSFVTGRNVSRAQAEIKDIRMESEKKMLIQAQYSNLESQINSLKENQGVIEKLDTHVVLSNVLAELSNLVVGDIVVSQMRIQAEEFEELQEAKKAKRNSAKSKTLTDDDVLPGDPVKFVVVINGIARDSLDVAGLIANMEKSEYFQNIVPGFSKNKEMGENVYSEFEISCCIANYIEKR